MDGCSSDRRGHSSGSGAVRYTGCVSQPVLRFDLDLRDAMERRLEPDALIVQEDRNLVLSAPPFLDLDAANDLDSAYMAIAHHRPLPQGRYLLLRPRGGRRHWLYQAVVHDLEHTPSCRPGDVRRSVLAVCRDAVKRGLAVLAMEPVGLWGQRGLTLDELVEALDTTFLELALDLEAPLRIVLLLDDLATIEEVSLGVRARVLRKASRSFRTVNGDAAVVEVRRDLARLHFRFVPGSLSGYMVIRADRVA